MYRVLRVSLVILLVVAFASAIREKRDFLDEYGIIIDCGGSSSKAFVYTWPARVTAQDYPDVVSAPRGSAQWTYKVSIPLNSFANNPSAAGQSLAPILSYLISVVPVARQSTTAVFLKATAGMRSLNTTSQNLIMENVRDYLQTQPFYFQRSWAQVIPGTSEGVFGWVSVNALQNTLNSAQPTYAALDMGSTSTQITFEATGVLSGAYSEKIGARTFNLYTHSFPTGGQDAALLALNTGLAAEGALLGTAIQNPCYLSGYGEAFNATLTVSGTGNWTACKAAVSRILVNTGVTCTQAPCSFGGVYQPSFAGNFIAFSGYYFTPQFFNILPNPSTTQLEAMTKVFCGTPWATAQAANPAVTSAILKVYCYTGAYFSELLQAYGVGVNSTAVTYASSLNGTAVGYALGAMMDETERLPLLCDGQGLLLGSGPQCWCYSGYASVAAGNQDCALNYDDVCTYDVTSTLSTTARETAFVNDVRFVGDTVTISLKANFVSNRTTTTISMVGGNDTVCGYPWSSTWIKSLDNTTAPTCYETYTYTLAWAAKSTCGWSISETAQWVTYTATLLVTDTEFVGYLLEQTPVYRNITSSLNVAVRFLKNATVSVSNLVVFAPISLEAAIVEQQYDAETDRAYISIQTSSQWPYKLLPPTLTLPSTLSVLESVVAVDDNCSADSASYFCSQTFRVTFDPNTCDLTGTYNFRFTVGCANQTVCGVDPTTNETRVTAYLTSENFCDTNVVSSDITFSGQLVAYGNSNFTVPRVLFLQNSTARFVANVSSLNATIVEVDVTDVSIVAASSNSSSSAVLLTAAVPTTMGNSSLLTITSSGAVAKISFRLLAAMVPVPTIMQEAFTVKATLKVGYLNSLGQKRFALATFDGTTAMRLGTQIFVELGDENTSPSGSSGSSSTSHATGSSQDSQKSSHNTASVASTVLISLGVLCAVLVVVAAVVVVVAMKKRQGGAWKIVEERI